MGIFTDIIKGIPVNAIQREKLEELEKKYDELEAENIQLKDEIQKLKDKVKELTSSDELCEIEVNILKLLSSSGRELTAEVIAREIGINLTKTEYYLEKMWRQYVNSHDWSNSRPSEYYLAQKGKEYLVKNDLV